MRDVTGVFGAALTMAALLLTGRMAHGETIAEKAQICSACHGEAGVPADPAFPVIWGQNEGYLYLQLRDIKRGTRNVEAMAPIVADLERDDMLALAAYFSAKPWPDLGQPAAPDAAARTAMQTNTSVGCTGCHGANYVGDAAIPRLAGQQHDYLAKTMLDFRNKVRLNNPGMSDLMNAAPEADLAAVAAYLAGM